MVRYGRGEDTRLVIPATMREEVLEDNHDYILAGPGGLGKTYAKVSQAYYWPNMQDDLAEYCSRCHLCIWKKDAHTRKTPLCPVHADYPFDKVFMDLVGPLPPSQEHLYIIVFVCAMTKWIEALPIRTSDAEDAAQALFHGVVLCHGCC